MSAHIHALELETSGIGDNKLAMEEFRQKFAAVKGNLAALSLPAAARAEFQSRLDILNRICEVKEATLRRGKTTEKHQSLKHFSGISMSEDVTRQLIEQILEIGSNG